MKTRMLVTLAVFLLCAVTPLAVATTFAVAEGILEAGNAGSCDSYALAPASPLSVRGAKALAIMTNEGPPSTARGCIVDVFGRKRLDFTASFDAGQRREIPLDLPAGSYTFRMEAAGGYAAGTIGTGWCMSGVDKVETRFDAERLMVGASSSGTCASSGFLIGGLGLVASGGAFAIGKFPGLGAFILYSRLVKPRLLDHTVRDRLHDLVSREPGIHSRELGRALGVADGQVAHHLGILARERLLVSIGLPAFRHWFVPGRYSRADMRAIAALRDPTRRALYDVVTANPGVTLAHAAGSVGVSKAAGSRAARALERVGIIERANVGQALVLRPAARDPATLPKPGA